MNSTETRQLFEDWVKQYNQKVREKRTNTPIARYNAGGVSVTVWENYKGDKKYLSFNLSRCYKDSDGNWQRTQMFFLNDLPKVMMLMSHAFKQSCLQEVKP